MTKIDIISLQVALKNSSSAETFSFPRTWTALRVVVKLVAVALVLVNITFLVAYADLSVEKLLIALPVLQQVEVDTNTLLERVVTC